MNRQIFKDLGRLVGGISKRRRFQYLILLGLMIITALAEVASLGAIIPFLGVLSSTEHAVDIPILGSLIEYLSIQDDPGAIRFTLTVFFCCAAVVSGLMRFLLIYATAKVNFGTVHELGAEVFRRTLFQSYEVHVRRNSSEIVGAIGKVDVVAWAVSFLVTALSASLMALSIIGTLIYIDPMVTVFVLGGVGGVYALVSLATKSTLKKNSEVINEAYGGRVQAVQEGLGGIRDMILDQSQTIFAGRFNEIDRHMRNAQASNAIIGPSPRFGVEALGMVLIASLAYVLTQREGGLGAALPMLGALALGAQRLMPLVQQIYRGVVYLFGNKMVIREVCELLAQPIAAELEQEVDRLPFNESIRLENITFRYDPEGVDVIQDLTLDIPKGSVVGFVGETGSGKSTLIDLIMGLLQTTKGKVLIDGQDIEDTTRLGWQKNIAHVPQSIFLLDATIAQNIAFGVPEDQIDIERVHLAAKKAQIADHVESLELKYDEIVGEQGVRLSGGQRQRIGIARAIYKSAPVLVLDEATSALDGDTEAQVISNVLGLGDDVTIMMIAHRLSTLESCDFIVRLDAGQIKSIEKNLEKGATK